MYSNFSDGHNILQWQTINFQKPDINTNLLVQWNDALAFHFENECILQQIYTNI